MENKMMPMMDPAVNGTPGDLPMEDTLCVFKFKPTNGSSLELLILGSLCFKEKFYVKQYGKKDTFFLPSNFSHYQPIGNEAGGFYFIKSATDGFSFIKS